MVVVFPEPAHASTIKFLFECSRVSIATCCSLEGGDSILGLSWIPASISGPSEVPRLDVVWLAMCENLLPPAVRNARYAGKHFRGVLRLPCLYTNARDALHGVDRNMDGPAEQTLGMGMPPMDESDMIDVGSSGTHWMI